ncbi:hypothetical protein BDZ97DRAFT_2026563 [Flammula alnicola]|nr:hypothetical protein BDZ97DRAFT_2026563 [Flammula alnicola]
MAPRLLLLVLIPLVIVWLPPLLPPHRHPHSRAAAAVVLLPVVVVPEQLPVGCSSLSSSYRSSSGRAVVSEHVVAASKQQRSCCCSSSPYPSSSGRAAPRRRRTRAAAGRAAARYHRRIRAAAVAPLLVFVVVPEQLPVALLLVIVVVPEQLPVALLLVIVVVSEQQRSCCCSWSSPYPSSCRSRCCSLSSSYPSSSGPAAARAAPPIWPSSSPIRAAAAVVLLLSPRRRPRLSEQQQPSCCCCHLDVVGAYPSSSSGCAAAEHVRRRIEQQRSCCCSSSSYPSSSSRRTAAAASISGQSPYPSGSRRVAAPPTSTSSLYPSSSSRATAAAAAAITSLPSEPAHITSMRERGTRRLGSFVRVVGTWMVALWDGVDEGEVKEVVVVVVGPTSNHRPHTQTFVEVSNFSETFPSPSEGPKIFKILCEVYIDENVYCNTKCKVDVFRIPEITTGARKLDSMGSNIAILTYRYSDDKLTLIYAVDVLGDVRVLDDGSEAGRSEFASQSRRREKTPDNNQRRFNVVDCYLPPPSLHPSLSLSPIPTPKDFSEHWMQIEDEGLECTRGDPGRGRPARPAVVFWTAPPPTEHAATTPRPYLLPPPSLPPFSVTSSHPQTSPRSLPMLHASKVNDEPITTPQERTSRERGGRRGRGDNAPLLPWAGVARRTPIAQIAPDMRVAAHRYVSHKSVETPLPNAEGVPILGSVIQMNKDPSIPSSSKFG